MNMENEKKVDMEKIKGYFDKWGYYLDEDILKSFYAAIMTEPSFVILSGPPGTGKTSFALLFAKAWEMVGDGGSGGEGKGDMGVVVDINGEKYGVFRYWIGSGLRTIRTNNYSVSFERSTIRCIDLKTGKSYSRDSRDFGITFDDVRDVIITITYDEKYLFIGLGYNSVVLKLENFVVLKLENLQQVVENYGEVTLNWIDLYHIFNSKIFDLIRDLGGFKGYKWFLDRYLVVWGNKIRVYDMKEGEGKIINEYGTADEWVGTELSPDNRYLVLEYQGELKVIDLENRNEIFSESNVKEFKIISYDKYLYLVVLASDYVTIYDLKEKKEMGIIIVGNGIIEIYELKYPFLGIYRQSLNKTIIYNLDNGEKYDLKGFKQVRLINDKYFAGIIRENNNMICNIYRIEPQQLKLLDSFKVEDKLDFETFKVSPDRKFAVIFDKRRWEIKVFLLDLRKYGNKIIKLTYTKSYYYPRLKIYNEEKEWKFLVTYNYKDEKISLFDVYKGWKEIWNYEWEHNAIPDFNFSPDGKFLAVWEGYGYTLYIYDIKSGQIYNYEFDDKYSIRRVEIDKTERYLYIGFYENIIKVIDFDDPKKSKEFIADFSSAEFVSKYFICESEKDNKLIILDLDNWEEVQYDSEKWIKKGKKYLIQADKRIIFDGENERVIEIPAKIHGKIEDFDLEKNILVLKISERDSLYLSIWDINAKKEIWREEIYTSFDNFYISSSDENFEITLENKRAYIMKIYIKKLLGFEEITDIKLSDKKEGEKPKDLYDALIQAQKSDRVLLIRVRPEWTNPRDVLGYRNINGQFVKGPIYDFIKRANGDKGNLYFLILDEMNLSHPEYYLSDIISAMETGGKMIIDGEEIEYPENLVIVGTINRDETTQNLSPRLLSRAITLEFRTNWDLVLKNDNFQVGNHKLAEIFKGIDEELKKAGLGIGYREYVRAKEFIRNSKNVGYDEIKALDEYINSKIVPRIRGIREDFIKGNENILENIIEKCEGLEKTKKSLEKKKEILESRGIVE